MSDGLLCSPAENVAEVTVRIGDGDLRNVADALGYLAGVDEGEHTDRDELLRLEAFLRSRLETPWTI